MPASLRAFECKSREDFQIWLASDVEARDELYALMPRKPGIDFESLDAIEAFLLKRYPKQKAALAPDQHEILDAVARHIGLVLVLGLDDATWTIDVDDKKNAYYRLPIVRMADGAEECPLAMATAALDRRKPGYLRGIAESYDE